MKFIKQVENYFLNKLGITQDIYSLFKLEAKLAELTILPFLSNLALLIASALSLWLSFMLLLGFIVWYFSHQILIAMVVVFIVNLLLILLIGRNLKRCLYQISFPKTRACLQEPQKRKDREPAEESAIAINSQIRKED